MLGMVLSHLPIHPSQPHLKVKSQNTVTAYFEVSSYCVFALQSFHIMMFYRQWSQPISQSALDCSHLFTQPVSNLFLSEFTLDLLFPIYVIHW